MLEELPLGQPVFDIERFFDLHDLLELFDKYEDLKAHDSLCRTLSGGRFGPFHEEERAELSEAIRVIFGQLVPPKQVS
jgi:hypothetical protein